MQLYRLDTAPEAGRAEPVCDLLGPVLFRSYARARARARGLEEARERGETVTLTTIRANGRLARTLAIQPDGRCRRQA